MDRTCANCVNLSNHDTELSVCRLRRRYTELDWTCQHYAHVTGGHGARYEDGADVSTPDAGQTTTDTLGGVDG